MIRARMPLRLVSVIASTTEPVGRMPKCSRSTPACSPTASSLPIQPICLIKGGHREHPGREEADALRQRHCSRALGEYSVRNLLLFTLAAFAVTAPARADDPPPFVPVY